jgi:hypothetical protein
LKKTHHKTELVEWLKWRKCAVLSSNPSTDTNKQKKIKPSPSVNEVLGQRPDWGLQHVRFTGPDTQLEMSSGDRQRKICDVCRNRFKKKKDWGTSEKCTYLSSPGHNGVLLIISGLARRGLVMIGKALVLVTDIFPSILLFQNSK